MTTWCRPDTTVSPDPPKRSSSNSSSSRTSIDHNESSSYHHLAHHPALISLSRERFHHLHYINQHRGRHSIADILGWVDGGGGGGGEQMTSDFVDMDVAYSDEPLDLSLDKSKGRKERDFEQGTPIKRAKYHHQDEQGAGSDPGTDEADADPAQSWNGGGVGVGGNGTVQPHLQMAANFSTVLQYYLTAARLWQTSEAMRCQESHNDSEGAGEAEASDPTAAVVAVMAAAAAASANAAPDHAPLASAAVAAAAAATPVPAAKKRKKDVGEASSASAVVDPQAGGVTRPRKTRTTFTGKQLFELERIFEQKKYLSSNERQEVARLLNVTGSQIKIWFQNRRTKWKKQDPNTAAELAQLKTASRSQQQQQQQQATPSSATPPVGKAKSIVGDALHSADASASEEGHSDDNSSHRSDSTPPV